MSAWTKSTKPAMRQSWPSSLLPRHASPRYTPPQGGAFAAKESAGADLRLSAPPANPARIHAALGEKDQAFERLLKASEERDLLIIGLKVDPTMDDLRSDPRFAQLLKDMGLPP
jgi:hypothetical protein